MTPDQIEDPQQIIVYGAGSKPISGMASYPHPLATPDGCLPLVMNMRCSDGVLQSRRGVSEFTTSGLPLSNTPGACLFLGATYWKDNAYAAYRVPITASGCDYVVSLFKSSDLVNWSEITAGTGAEKGIDPNSGIPRHSFGDCSRFPWNKNMHVSFQPVTAQRYFQNTSSPYSDYDLLLIGNGYPDAVGSNAHVTNGFLIGTASQLYAPSHIGKMESRARFGKWLNLQTESPTITHDSGNTIVISTQTQAIQGDTSLLSKKGKNANRAAVTARWFQVKLPAASATLGGWAQFAVGTGVLWSGISLSSCTTRQVVMVVETEYPDAFDYLAIDVKVGSDYYTLYDPASGVGSCRVEAYGDTYSNQYLIIIDSDAETWPSYTMDAIRFSLVRADYPADATMQVYAVAWGGDYEGGSQYAVSWLDSWSQAESPSVTLKIGTGPSISEIGGPPGKTEAAPQYAGVYYIPVVPIEIPDPAVLATQRNIDTILIYRRTPDGDDFYAVPGWGEIALTRSVVNEVEQWSLTYHAATTAFSAGETLDWHMLSDAGMLTEITAPDAFHIGVPPFTCGTVAGNRVVLGSQGNFFVSDANNPFRYRRVPKIVSGSEDPTSPTMIHMPGETAQASAAMSSSMLGSQQVALWTNKGMYVIDLASSCSVPSFIGPTGTLSPGSVAQHQSTTWVLDDHRHYRVFESAGASDISTGIVEDWFQSPTEPNVPLDSSETERGIAFGRLDDVAAIWHNYRLYVAFTPSGGTTNTHVLVFDSRTGGWVLDTLPNGFDCVQWLEVPDTVSGRTKLIAFGFTGRIFEYEDPTVVKDFGDELINARFSTPEYSEGPWGPIRVGEVGVMCDASESAASVSYDIRLGDGNDTGEIDLSGVGIVRARASQTGARAAGVRADVSVNVEAGWRLYAVTLTRE